MTTKRNIHNLEALAALFDTLPQWDDPTAGEHADRYIQEAYGRASSCGTYCCLAGWEMVRLYGHDTLFNEAYGPMPLTYRTDGRGPGGDWEYDAPEDIVSHAANSLGITADEAHVLFGSGWKPTGGEYNDPAAAAEALRRLAKGHRLEEVTDPEYYTEYCVPIRDESTV
jgi:hypothetical protein